MTGPVADILCCIISWVLADNVGMSALPKPDYPAPAPTPGSPLGDAPKLRLAQRLDAERAHFDAHYTNEAHAGIEPLSASDRWRYTDPSAKTIYPREFYHHLLGPARGKRILEIACGNGIDASILAHNGAEVFAYDLSPASIVMTGRRAEVNGVGDRVHASVGSSVAEAFYGQTFDHVVGYAALHHLPDFGTPEFAQAVLSRLRPGGTAVFAEPVINSRVLARLRAMVPWSIDADTEDEVPLTEQDVRRFAAHFAQGQADGPKLTKRYFQVTSRVWRFWPKRYKLAKWLHRIDAAAMPVPGVWRLATVCVFSVTRPGA